MRGSLNSDLHKSDKKAKNSDDIDEYIDKMFTDAWIAGEPLDLLLERPEDAPGTVVFMSLANSSPRTTQLVFNEFAAPEATSFSRTIVPVRLALYEGETLVSRSQARRVYLRFERFQNVVLDFEGINEIGQAFADELFRVFVAAHPAVKLTTVNMSKAVQSMFVRVTRSEEA